MQFTYTTTYPSKAYWQFQDSYECKKDEGKHWKHYTKWVQRSLNAELGEERQSRWSNGRRKFFTETLQKLWWVRDMLNSGCLKTFLSNSDEHLQWCMENVKWLQYWNNNVILKSMAREKTLMLVHIIFQSSFFFSW